MAIDFLQCFIESFAWGFLVRSVLYLSLEFVGTLRLANKEYTVLKDSSCDRRWERVEIDEVNVISTERLAYVGTQLKKRLVVTLVARTSVLEFDRNIDVAPLMDGFFRMRTEENRQLDRALSKYRLNSIERQ